MSKTGWVFPAGCLLQLVRMEGMQTFMAVTKMDGVTFPKGTLAKASSCGLAGVALFSCRMLWWSRVNVPC